MICIAWAALIALRPQSSPDYHKTWDQVRRIIRDGYYARGTRKDEMNRLLDKYEPIAESSGSPSAFETTVNQMIAEFGDSHFAYYSSSDQNFYMMDGLANKNPTEMPNIGVWFRATPAGFSVQMVLDGSDAQKAGLRKGDVVTSVNAVPFSPVDALSPFVGQTVTLSVLRSGTNLSMTVGVKKQSAVDLFLTASRDSAKIIDDNGRKIGYFHLWTQANDQFRSALASAVYGRLANTDAFILDLRDGFGGRPENFADPFFRPEVRLDWKSPSGSSQELFGYSRPLIVLINSGSRSAKEVLSYILKKSRRAKLVGSTTAGNVLGTFPMKLNNGAYLELPMVDVFADGERLEGHGVSPDVRIEPEFDSTGHDRVLEKALEMLAHTKRQAVPASTAGVMALVP